MAKKKSKERLRAEFDFLLHQRHSSDKYVEIAFLVIVGGITTVVYGVINNNLTLQLFGLLLASIAAILIFVSAVQIPKDKKIEEKIEEM